MNLRLIHRLKRRSNNEPSARVTYALTAFCIIISAVIAALFVVDLQTRYNNRIGDAKRNAENFAEVLAEHTARSFEAVERAMHEAENIRDELSQGKLTAAAAHNALRYLQRTSPVLVAIGWTDAEGNLQAHSYERDPPRPSIADLPYFIAHRDHPDLGLMIAKPFRSVATGQWITAASLRLTNADGSFAGIVSAPLNQAYFASIYQAIKPGEHGSVFLIHRDGETLIREPFVESAIGRSFTGTAFFQKYLPSAESGSFEGTSSVDGRSRIYGYKAVPGLPLVVAVTYDRADVLKPWYQWTRTFGPTVALLIAGLLLSSGLLLRRTRALTKQGAVTKGIIEHMDQGLVLVDRDGRVVTSNDRARMLLDLPAGFLETRPSAEEVRAFLAEGGEYASLPASAADKYRRHMAALRRGELVVYERVRPNGVSVEVRMAPMPDGGTILTYTDITARKQIEAALRESEERFRIMTAHVPGMVFRRVQTPDGRVSFPFISAGITDLCGLTPEEVMADGSSLLKAIHPDDRGLLLENARKSAEDLSPVRNEVRFVARDGATRWVQTLAQPTRATNGDVIWDGVTIDVTALKEAEAAAEAANRAKTEFLASMSHELRTPLTSILGFADLLLDQNVTPEQRRYLELQRDAGQILLAVVNDILDFSKIEAGALQLEALPLDLRSMVDSCGNIFAQIAKSKNIDLLVSVSADLPDAIVGDPVRLRQVLHNLLSNAIKFTQKGRVELAVKRLHYGDTAHCHLRFDVKDTGIGIPPEKIERLFQRFSQVDSSTARQYGGTGLGLAISRHLVEAMGGKIGVNSVAGIGSEFWFELALPIASEIASRGEERAALSGPVAPRRILLAEDVEANQILIAGMLRAVGHHVDIASEGAAAVDAARSGAYDVILMDMQMPRMDGLAATRLIRARERPAEHVPIIALTANVMSSEVQRCIEAGMDAHASKPIDRLALLRLIDDLAASHTQGRSVVRGSFRLASNRERSLDAIDVEVLQELERVLGHDRLVQLLTIFDRGLSMRSVLFDKPDGVSTSQLREVGHALVGMAGNLGFMRLSNLARNLLEIDAQTPAAEVSVRVAAVRAAALQVGEDLPYLLEADSIDAAREMLSAQETARASRQLIETEGTTTGVA